MAQTLASTYTIKQKQADDTFRVVKKVQAESLGKAIAWVEWELPPSAYGYLVLGPASEIPREWDFRRSR